MSADSQPSVAAMSRPTTMNVHAPIVAMILQSTVYLNRHTTNWPLSNDHQPPWTNCTDGL